MLFWGPLHLTYPLRDSLLFNNNNLIFNNMLKSHTVLYLEDDTSSAETFQLYLRQKNLLVHHYTKVDDALRALNNIAFDLAVLDVMLPDGDGRDVLKQAVERKIPTIMVTARIVESDRVEGFELGADDYVCKPYSPRELISRVVALLKRSQQGHQITELKFEGLAINLDTLTAKLDEHQLLLTSAEFKLLHKLAELPGRVMSRAELLNFVNNEHSAVTERTIDTHLANIRKKLNESKQNPRFIETRYGQGYVFIGKRVQA